MVYISLLSSWLCFALSWKWHLYWGHSAAEVANNGRRRAGGGEGVGEVKGSASACGDVSGRRGGGFWYTGRLNGDGQGRHHGFLSVGRGFPSAVGGGGRDANTERRHWAWLPIAAGNWNLRRHRQRLKQSDPACRYRSKMEILSKSVHPSNSAKRLIIINNIENNCHRRRGRTTEVYFRICRK